MDYSKRYVELLSVFTSDKEFMLPDANIVVKHFSYQSKIPQTGSFIKTDSLIKENTEFTYPVFFPKQENQFSKAILLLHGLNERNWNKYLTWAEFLCSTTGKPVILFPIAFHMNRSPLSWTNPRTLKPVLDLRKKLTDNDRSLSFANLALSERITENPFRFYNSGRQSLDDISNLLIQIKSGQHAGFTENTGIDVFAYSIGAFLSQIAFMGDTKGLFAESKLFMFCGGSIFSSMFGESRSIMDRTAFEKLFQFYKNEFSSSSENENMRDAALESFLTMIAPERNTEKRQNFFTKMGDRLKGISMFQDKVIPYSGVIQALGQECAASHISLLDFPYRYEHEQPFPVSEAHKPELINRSFLQVFNAAAGFLA